MARRIGDDQMIYDSWRRNYGGIDWDAAPNAHGESGTPRRDVRVEESAERVRDVAAGIASRPREIGC